MTNKVFAMRSLVIAAVVAILFSMATLALAIQAPQHDNVFTAVVVTAHVATPQVVVASTPPLSAGYDVICNRSESLSLQPTAVVTTTRRGLSATVDWRSLQPTASYRRDIHRYGRSAPSTYASARTPEPVLRA